MMPALPSKSASFLGSRRRLVHVVECNVRRILTQLVLEGWLAVDVGGSTVGSVDTSGAVSTSGVVAALEGRVGLSVRLRLYKGLGQVIGASASGVAVGAGAAHVASGTDAVRVDPWVSLVGQVRAVRSGGVVVRSTETTMSASGGTVSAGGAVGASTTHVASRANTVRVDPGVGLVGHV
jgi:hypothetical protein